MKDRYCDKIMSLLTADGQSTPRTVAKLQEKSGLVRSTLFRHLSHLDKLSLVTKEEISKEGKRGRRKILYHATEPNIIAEIKGAERVNIAFGAMRMACRFRKRSICKMTEDACMMAKCPMVADKLIPFSLKYEHQITVR